MRTTCLDSSPFHCIAIPHHTVANLTICSLAIQHHSVLERAPRAARRRAAREPFVISNGVRNPGAEVAEQTLCVGRKLLGSLRHKIRTTKSPTELVFSPRHLRQPPELLTDSRPSKSPEK